MTEGNDKAVEQDSSKAGGAGKRKYEKPAFRFERVFETMALSCGKISPTEFQCRFNRKTS
jgi:hypothetical protein